MDLLADAQFDPVAEHVPAKDVAFLDAGCVLRINAQCGVRDADHCASPLAGKGDGEAAPFLRGFEGEADIFAVSGSGDSNQDIALLAQRFHLAAKHMFVACLLYTSIQEGHILCGHMLCDWIELSICQ